MITVNNLDVQFGKRILFQDVNMKFTPGNCYGIIGANGAGKSTFLRVIRKQLDPTRGTVSLGPGERLSVLSQDHFAFDEYTVMDTVLMGHTTLWEVMSEKNALYAKPDFSDADGIRVSELEEKFAEMEGWNAESDAAALLSGLGIAEEFHYTLMKDMSGKQKVRVLLARALFGQPDNLLLDEPTNDLDIQTLTILEDYLDSFDGIIITVSHDRYFLDRVCSEIIEIDRKQIYQYKGNYSYYLEKRQERMDALNAEVDRASNLLRKELDWMRRQPQARGTKAKYRIDAFYELEKKAKQQHEAGNVNLDVKASYIGSKIFEAEHVSKRFGDLKIVEDFNYIFARYEKMGIVGNNGTGKSTFIKMLMGEVEPDSGRFDVGETVRFGYYSQDGLQFDEQMKVIDVVQNIAEYVDLGDGKKMGVSQFLNYFLFAPEKQHNYVYKLSGGEKRRLYLCTVLMRSPNFLVLDEPTNDLDIVTLNVLEEYLRNFKGCAIVVSHDRYFMDKVVDHLLVFRGNADIKDFPGNYTQYREWKEVQDQLEKETEAARQARMAPTVEKTSRLEKVQKKKLTFKERKEFEALEVEIPLLEAEKAELETAMSSGTLSNDELLAKSERIAKVIEEIDEKTMRWLELSELA